MKLLAIIAAVAFALAGCTTVEKIDTAIQANIGQFCAGAASTQAIYLAASPAIPERYTKRVSRAYATIEGLCADPAKVNTVTLTAALAAHIAAIKAAKTAAKEG
jgi:hypothetical protein